MCVVSNMLKTTCMCRVQATANIVRHTRTASYGFLQVTKKKRLAYGGIMFIWIFIPAYLTLMGSVSSDIIKGICVPWNAYSSYEAQQTIVWMVFLVAYILPLITMVFGYSRIVYTIRHKVMHTTLSCNANFY